MTKTLCIEIGRKFSGSVYVKLNSSSWEIFIKQMHCTMFSTILPKRKHNLFLSSSVFVYNLFNCIDKCSGCLFYYCCRKFWLKYSIQQKYREKELLPLKTYTSDNKSIINFLYIICTKKVEEDFVLQENLFYNHYNKLQSLYYARSHNFLVCRKFNNE